MLIAYSLDKLFMDKNNINVCWKIDIPVSQFLACSFIIAISLHIFEELPFIFQLPPTKNFLLVPILS